MPTLHLSFSEVRAIRRGLKRLRYETRKSVERGDREGWKPEPGRLDVNRETIKTIDSLLDRLPITDYPVDPGNAASAEEHSS